jgi:hypothetical protein
MGMVGKAVLVALLALICLVLLQDIVTAQEKEEPAPKIKKIVLYKHGVGYFERRGNIKDNATITLSFKAAQIKDLLTSLYAIDSKGRVVSIGYDSKDPIEKQLEGVLIRVPEASALTQFLMQLKGARVEVTIGNKPYTGHILGIEPIVEKKEQTTILTYKLVILSDDGQIQPVNLLEVSGVRILDEMIQADLKRVLGIYLNSKYTDRKQVKISTQGTGEREIQIGYIIEAPIWKTSYRLILSEKEKPKLQGWAIVENPTDEDWEEVQLSLVAGNPISFVMDLYTPYYPARPEILLSSLIPGAPSVAGLVAKPREANERTKFFGPALRAGEKPTVEIESAIMEMGKANKGYGGLVPASPAAPALAELLASSFEAIAQGAAAGELFSYDVTTPVTIPRNKAALVPIISEPVDGEKILYYNRSVSASPTNAFYFKNTTNFTLEAGPVTLFEVSTSVGEGIFKKALKPGMNEIIPYALETGCTVELISARSLPQPAHSASLTAGFLEVKQWNILEAVYKITNQMGKAFTLYFDHPKTEGYKLIEPEKAEEEVSGLYRFKISLAPNETKEFKVKEKMEVSSRIYVRNMRTDEIKVYIAEPHISKETKAFLSEILTIMEERTSIARQILEKKADIEKQEADQERCRRNLEVLKDTPEERDIRKGYLDRLTKADKRIDELTEIITDLREKEKLNEEKLIKKIQEYKEEEK